jgi:hypothetical protein
MRRILLLLPLPVACFAAPDSSYQVTFKAFTAFGEPVKAHVTVLADPLHRRDLAAHCAGLVCSEIPEGAYTYSILIDETGRKVDGSAVVYRTNQVISVDVGTPAGELDDSTFPRITGRVLNASEPAKVWIRLQQLYSDASVSARLEKDGSFVLDQVRPGKWMLLVFVDGRLVHSEPYTCKEKDNPPVVVRLPSKEMLKATAGPALVKLRLHRAALA